MTLDGKVVRNQPCATWRARGGGVARRPYLNDGTGSWTTPSRSTSSPLPKPNRYMAFSTAKQGGTTAMSMCIPRRRRHRLEQLSNNLIRTPPASTRRSENLRRRRQVQHTARRSGRRRRIIFYFRSRDRATARATMASPTDREMEIGAGAALAQHLHLPQPAQAQRHPRPSPQQPSTTTGHLARDLDVPRLRRDFPPVSSTGQAHCLPRHAQRPDALRGGHPALSQENSNATTSHYLSQVAPSATRRRATVSRLPWRLH